MPNPGLKTKDEKGKRQKADERWKTGNGRLKTGDYREEKQQMADGSWEMGNGRLKTGDYREEKRQLADGRREMED